MSSIKTISILSSLLLSLHHHSSTMVVSAATQTRKRNLRKTSNNNQPANEQQSFVVAPSNDNNTKYHFIFSTDCSGGLYGPNANYDECPAIIQSNNNGTINGPADYRDIDDLMAITIALNSQDDVVVDAIVPTFGDASMRANFLTGTQLVHNIKGRTDIPIVPGASEASQPVFIDGFRIIGDINEVGWNGPLPTAQYQKPESSASTSEGNMIDPIYMFEMSCINAGVTTMLNKIEDAYNNNYQVDLMAIGPKTDIACALLHLQQNDDDKHFKAIRQIVALIGQEAGVPNGSSGATARDFNMISDPLAATIVLSFSDKIKIVLMEFQLTIQTTTEKPILFNETTFAPDTLEFFKQAKATARPTEGPFDQYTVAYALHPEWFECDEYPTYVIQCNQNDGTLQTESTPPGIECTTSTGYSTSYVGGVSAELTIDIEKKYDGPLVVGNARGNILNYQDHSSCKSHCVYEFCQR